MISEEDLACYRINYDPAPYEEAVRRGGDQLVVPIGAVWAIRALCDEVERLNARIKELEAAFIPKLEQSWADYSKSAAGWWQVLVNPELQREIDDAWAAIQAKANAEPEDQWDECLDDAISPTMRIKDA